MPDGLGELIRWFLGLGVGGGVLVGFAKVLAPHLLARDLERFRDDLKRESTEAIERTKAELAKQHVVHDEYARLRIRLQTKALTRVASAMAVAEDAHVKLVIFLGEDSPTRRALWRLELADAYDAAHRADGAFHALTSARSPWLPFQLRASFLPLRAAWGEVRLTAGRVKLLLQRPELDEPELRRHLAEVPGIQQRLTGATIGASGALRAAVDSPPSDLAAGADRSPRETPQSQ